MSEKKGSLDNRMGNRGKKGRKKEIPGLEKEPGTIAEKMKKKGKIYT